MPSNVDSRARNRVLLVLFLGVLMGALDIAIVGPALKPIQRYFGVDDRLLAWIFNIYVLFNLIGTPLMAKLSDLFGRKAIYVLDVSLFAAGSLIVALSPSFDVMLAGRALQGLGAGGVFPVASAVIGDTFPPERRGSALGLIGAVFGIAFMFGPIVGGILLSVAAWQWLFVINLPVAAVVALMGLRLLPATRPAQRRPFDWAGMLVLGTLLAALAIGINRIDTANFVGSLATPAVGPFLLLALALLPVFWLVERRAEDPVLRLSLFGSRQAIIATTLAAGAGLGEVGMVYLPKLAIAGLGLTDHSASYMLMTVVVAMAIGSPLAGRLLDRVGSKVVVMSGSVLLALGMLLLGFFATSLPVFIVAGLVIGAGLSALLGAPVRYMMLNETPAADRAAAQGALALFTSVGQLLSGALVGAVAASYGGGVPGYTTAYLMVAAVAVALSVLTLGLKSRAQELRTQERHMATSQPVRAHG